MRHLPQSVKEGGSKQGLVPSFCHCMTRAKPRWWVYRMACFLSHRQRHAQWFVYAWRPTGLCAAVPPNPWPLARCDDISPSGPWHSLRTAPGTDSFGKPSGCCGRAAFPLCWRWYAEGLSLWADQLVVFLLSHLLSILPKKPPLGDFFDTLKDLFSQARPFQMDLL